MNDAVRVLSAHLGFAPGEAPRDSFGDAERQDADAFSYIHPDAQFALFGPDGAKQLLQGRAALEAFVGGCADALDGHRDEILAITPVDEQCAFVHASAWCRSRATREEAHYEWSMLFRVEEGWSLVARICWMRMRRLSGAGCAARRAPGP